MLKMTTITKQRPFFFILGMTLYLLSLVSGCQFGAKPSFSVNQYTLEYPPPVFQGRVQIQESIKIERFLVSQTFDTVMMVYKEGPYLRNTDMYNRWRTKPGDMVTDYLARDFRNSGLFKAVFSNQDYQETRYLLKGKVDDFLDATEKGERKALLSLNVIFLDLGKKERGDRVVFQRDYHLVETFIGKTPEAFAQAMSQAMEKFSRQLILEVYQAVKTE